jgi:pimeloyl-ACP methyl ester carboxylesterase
MGHSLGGATAAAAMVNDSRIICGLNLDGAFFGPVIQEGLSRPFLNFGSQGHNRFNTTYPDAAEPDTSWNQTWPRMTGWKLELSLNDSAHNTFSDMPFLFNALGLEMTSFEWILGSLKGKWALEIVTTYMNAFFDFVLRGVESDLLRSESKTFPEVTFIE